jgi:hypothetical protein
VIKANHGECGTTGQAVKARPFLGAPLQDVTPKPPKQSDFLYLEHMLSRAPAPTELTLTPPPSATPPKGQTFPQALVFHLRKDHRFRRGWCYYANYVLSKMPQHREELMVTSTPPNIKPELVDGCYVASPIPGMIQMIPGIPYVFFLDGNPDRVHTVGCLQTFESLRWYDDFEETHNLCIQLAKLTWGCKAQGDVPAIPRLSHLPGLKRNLRSKKLNGAADINHPNHTEGSYSLANTVLQGEGQGSVLPAVQVDSPEAVAQISSVLGVLHQLYQKVISKCTSKFELEVCDFHHDDNNVFGFGGLEPNGTGNQLNVSCLGGDLKSDIGAQGFWHNDQNDDENDRTLFTLQFAAGPSTYSVY